MIWWLLLAVGHASYGCNVTAETFDELCEQWACTQGEYTVGCVTITLTKTDSFLEPNDNYFYEFGSYIHFMVEIPTFDKGFSANLTSVVLWFDGFAPVRVYDENYDENPFVTSRSTIDGDMSLIHASVEVNETLLNPHIDGQQHDMDVTFRVGNEERSEIVQRRVFPIVIVADRCIHQSDKLAAPFTYAQFPCPCEGSDCPEPPPDCASLEDLIRRQNEINRYDNGTKTWQYVEPDPELVRKCNQTSTTTTTTAASERVILRYCSIYGWDDESSKNFCDENQDTHTYVETTRVEPKTNGLVIMIGIILIGLLLLMCVGLCLFQRMELEEDRLRAKLAEEIESSTSGESGSEGEGSTSYQDHIAREGEQIATKLEILNNSRPSKTFKGVITENNKITAAATKVRYQLEQLMATKEQEESTKKRRVGEEEYAEKRAPVAAVKAAPQKEDDLPLVQFPINIETHQGARDLLGSSGSPTIKSPPEGSASLERGTTEKKSGRIAAELATLALLKETGNLTNEEFLYSKNLILYE